MFEHAASSEQALFGILGVVRRHKDERQIRRRAEVSQRLLGRQPRQVGHIDRPVAGRDRQPLAYQCHLSIVADDRLDAAMGRPRS